MAGIKSKQMTDFGQHMWCLALFRNVHSTSSVSTKRNKTNQWHLIKVCCNAEDLASKMFLLKLGEVFFSGGLKLSMVQSTDFFFLNHQLNPHLFYFCQSFWYHPAAGRKMPCKLISVYKCFIFFSIKHSVATCHAKAELVHTLTSTVWPVSNLLMYI